MRGTPAACSDLAQALCNVLGETLWRVGGLWIEAGLQHAAQRLPGRLCMNCAQDDQKLGTRGLTGGHH